MGNYRPSIIAMLEHYEHFLVSNLWFSSILGYHFLEIFQIWNWNALGSQHKPLDTPSTYRYQYYMSSRFLHMAIHIDFWGWRFSYLDCRALVPKALNLQIGRAFKNCTCLYTHVYSHNELYLIVLNHFFFHPFSLSPFWLLQII